MHIDWNPAAIAAFRVRPHRLADHRPDGEIGDEMIVHHVEMNYVGTRGNHGAHFFAQSGEIGRKNRGCKAVSHR